MKIMKLLMFLIGLLAVLALGLYLSAGFLVKQAVSSLVPPITGTYASVDDVDIGFFSGRLGLKNLTISNPAGFSTPTLFNLESVEILFDPSSLFQQTLVISRIAIKGINIHAEMNQKGQFNLVVVNDNIQSYLTTRLHETAEQKSERADETGSSKQVKIKELDIQDTTLQLTAFDQNLTINIPSIHQTDIGNNQTPAEVIAVMLGTISSESVKNLLTSGREMLGQHLKIDSQIFEHVKAAGKMLEPQGGKQRYRIQDLF